MPERKRFFSIEAFPYTHPALPLLFFEGYTHPALPLPQRVAGLLKPPRNPGPTFASNHRAFASHNSLFRRWFNICPSLFHALTIIARQLAPQTFWLQQFRICLFFSQSWTPCMYLADYPALSFHLYVDTSGSGNPRGGLELARKGLINIRNTNQLALIALYSNCLTLYCPVF